MFGSGDRVASRYMSTETHRGMFWGIEATARRVEIQEISIFRTAEGRTFPQWRKRARERAKLGKLIRQGFDFSDIGVTRAMAAAETEKFFWRPWGEEWNQIAKLRDLPPLGADQASPDDHLRWASRRQRLLRGACCS